jgi:hypothetical protein
MKMSSESMRAKVFFFLLLSQSTLSILYPAAIKTLISSKFAATSLACLSLSFPFGNVGYAIESIIKDPEAITCSLDTMLTDENHGSCQQLDRVVRLRAGKLLTIKQVIANIGTYFRAQILNCFISSI